MVTFVPVRFRLAVSWKQVNIRAVAIFATAFVVFLLRVFTHIRRVVSVGMEVVEAG